MVEKPVFQTKMRCQMFPQRPNAMPLGGMVSGGDEGYAAFIGEMEILLGNLSGDKGIRTLCDGGFKIALCSAATPRHLADILGVISNGLRNALQPAPDPGGELGECLGMLQLTYAGDVLFAEPALFDQSQ